MFKAFKEKFWDNPYWAAVTEPLRIIGRITVSALDHFTESVKDAARDTPYDKRPKIMRLPGRLVSTSRDSSMLAIGSFLMMAGGMVGGGIVGGMGGFAAAAGGGMAAQVALAAVGGVAAAALGIYAGAAAFAGTIAFGAATIGATYGLTAGLVQGAIKSYRHHQTMKNAPAVAAVTATVTAATPPAQQAAYVTEKVSEIVDRFLSLPPESREALFTELERINGNPPRQPVESVEKVAETIQRMPAEDRQHLIEQLQEKLSGDFGAVVRKKAQKAQQELVGVYKRPINLKLKRGKSADAAAS